MPLNDGNGGVTDTIVLIHGLWFTALSWEHWIERYRVRGYPVLAPNWPGMDVDIDDLRRDPSAVAGVGMTEIVDHYVEIIRALDGPPIIIGHSFGGLAVEILLDRGLAAAGVAIDPAPVKGIKRLPYSTLKIAFPVLRNPANRVKAATLTAKQFRYAITHNLSEQEAAMAYARYSAPGPNRLLFEASFANVTRSAPTRVNFENNQRPPLLLIGGGKDRFAPASVTRSNFKLFRKSDALTTYKEFPDRSHYTVVEPGWEHVADYALTWAMNALNGT